MTDETTGGRASPFADEEFARRGRSAWPWAADDTRTRSHNDNLSCDLFPVKKSVDEKIGHRPLVAMGVEIDVETDVRNIEPGSYNSGTWRKRCCCVRA